MKALLLHDIVPDAAVAQQLAEAGYEVVRCAPSGTKAFPCVGMTGACPLDGTVDVVSEGHWTYFPA